MLHLLQLNPVLVGQIRGHKNLAALTGKSLASLISANGIGSHFLAAFLSIKSCRVLFLVCNLVTRWPCRLFAEFTWKKAEATLLHYNGYWKCKPCDLWRRTLSWVSQDLSIFVRHSSALLENTIDLSYRFSKVIYECTRWEFTTWPLAQR